MDINYTKPNRNIEQVKNAWQFIQKQWYNAFLHYIALHVFLNKNISVEFGIS